MKKIAALLFVMLLVGSAAFAQVTFGAWGRAIFYPAASSGVSGADITVSNGPRWNGDFPGVRVGIAAHGTSDNVGFDLNIDGDGFNRIGIGDNARVFVKFNDMVRIDIGKAQIDNLRGKIGTVWVVGGEGEDSIFNRFYPNAGLVVSLTPIPNFFFGVAADAQPARAETETANLTSGKVTDTVTFTDVTAKAAYSAAQVGLGYTLEGIGQVRAQYYGPKRAINAAFAYTGMEGLVADLGFWYYTSPNWGSDFRAGNGGNVKVRAAAKYSKDALAAEVRVGADLGNSSDLAMPVSLDLIYTVASPLAVGFGFAAGDILADSFSATIPVFMQLKYAKGDLIIGFRAKPTAKATGSGSDFAWDIPVGVTYSF